MRLPEYCKTYQAALSGGDCERLIELFELAEEKEQLDRQGAPKFTQVYMNKSYPAIVKGLVDAVMTVYDRYCEDYPHTKWMPPPKILESFRVKRYVENTDERFDTHVDVADMISAKRYLAFLFYLNEDFEGGETEFEGGPKVSPKTGSVLVFPPTWQFPHAGLRVTKGTKYIMSTYLCFA